MDLYPKEIISFEISDHPTVERVMKPLLAVLERIKELKYRTTTHSDQGIQYQSHIWQNALKTNKTFQRMSRMD